MRERDLVVAEAQHLAARPVVGEDQRRLVEPVEGLEVADAEQEDLDVAVGRDAQQLAVLARGVLREIRLARIAGADVERAVGAEADAAAVVEGAGRDSGEHHFLQRRALVIGGQLPALQLVLRSGHGDVDEEPRGVLRVEGDAEQPPFGAFAGLDGQHRLLLELALAQEADTAGPLADEHFAAGEEGEAPRHLQAAHHRLRAQRQLAVRSPAVALLQDAGGDQREQDHARSLWRARRYLCHRFGRSLWHGHYTTKVGGAAQHQEGGCCRPQEEDDQQAAEEDAHRSREAGEQGEAAEAEALNPARVAPAVPQRRGSPRAAWGPRGYGPRPRLYTCSKSALSVAVDGFAVVDEEIGHEDVEVAPPVALVAVPRLGLLGQPVNQNQGRLAAIGTWAEPAQPGRQLRG